MNSNFSSFLIKKHCHSAKKICINKNSVLYTDSNGKKYVTKKNTNNMLNIYNYLNSRGFGYLPRLVYCDDTSYVYEYQENTDTPDEQRVSDLVKIDALLHSKTVYYKDVSLDETKEIYEKLSDKIKNTFTYYDDLVTMIESNVYMSPSEYMLARNCSMIFSGLNFCQKKLDEWYKIASGKNKKRVVLLHNNLDSNHIIGSKDGMLISWNYATYDLPIYDFIKLYKNNYDKYDFIELYKEYVKIFPLLEEEKNLMYVILFIPNKIVFNKSQFDSTIEVGKLCNYLFTTDKLFMENEAKNGKVQYDNIDKKKENLKSTA